jgi:hypothetical protein
MLWPLDVLREILRIFTGDERDLRPGGSPR